MGRKIPEMCVSYRPLVKSAYQKKHFLISQSKHVVGTRNFLMESSFEHPKRMFKLMGKKIFTILRSKNFVYLNL